jgi:glutathione S-transferase
MALSLYFHPLASYCWKVLIALYEGETPFEPRLVDLGNAEQREAFYKVAPLGKFPVLRDEAGGRLVYESTIIIEYLALHHAGRAALVPADGEAALEVRAQDRFFDQQIHEPMQKHVGDKLRPADKRDPHGVEQAHAQLEKAYGILEDTLAGRTWAAGETFSMADCAAAPALYYANLVHPIAARYERVTSYLKRLQARPSFARVIAEAQPYFSMFPG